MTGPLARYESLLENQDIHSDPAQREAIVELNRIYQSIMQYQSSFRRWTRTMFLQRSIKGLYLWGDVGRGKTFLMDLFFHSLSKEMAIRLHFHRFMHTIHSELAKLQGRSDPLAYIAKQFAKQYCVLCFDEFHVSDIADAMLLGELCKHLFEQGVVIVATSNVEPQKLYHNGLQRDKFLPTIALIYEYMHVFNLQGNIDYRLQYLSDAKCYHTPLNDASELALQRAYQTLTFEHDNETGFLTLCERPVKTVCYADGVAWFTFEELCESARSSEDYIEIAQRFHTLIVSDVPQMDEHKESAAKRFMHLIDECYDRHVVLILSAEVPIDALYAGHLIASEFSRIKSRLHEMQSSDYLSMPHLP